MKQSLFVFMPMFVCGIMMVILFLEQLQRPTRALLTLAIFMGVAALLYLGHCVYFIQDVPLIPLTDTLYVAANLLVFPLYFIYIRCLTTHKTPWYVIFLAILPSLLCGLLTGVLYILMDEQETTAFINSYLYQNIAHDANGLVGLQVAVHHVGKILFALEIIPVLWFGSRCIHDFDKMLECNYSSIDDKKLTWVKVMLFVFSGTSLVSFVSNIVGRHRFVNDIDMLSLPSTLFSFLLFTIGYVGLKQKGLEDLDKENEKEKSRYRQDDLQLPSAVEDAQKSVEDMADMSLRQRIELLMVRKKLFLQPQLKLNDLVSALNSNRNYVYQAINIDMGMSFSEYVNRLRIDYAKQLIIANPAVPFADIAIYSGFSSSISFYRNFRLYVKCSPQEFRNSHILFSDVNQKKEKS